MRRPIPERAAGKRQSGCLRHAAFQGQNELFVDGDEELVAQ
jgi:hypothetical protein